MTKRVTFLSIIFLAWMILSSHFYKVNFPNPGSDDSTGWWGWYDQGMYLQQMIELENEGLVKSKSQVYPPSYMVVSIFMKELLGFVGLEKTHGESIFLTNQFLVFISFVILLFNLNAFRLLFFLSYLFLLVVFSSDVAGSFYVPWSSTITLLCCIVLYQIYNYRECLLNSKLTLRILVSCISALLLSILFHSRPQDFALIAFALSLSVVIEARKDILLLLKRIIIYAFVFFVLFELVWYYFADGLALGGLYTESPHSFIFNNIPEKLYGIFLADYRYGDFSFGLYQKSPWLFLFVTLPIIFAFIYGSLLFKIFFVSWVVLYLSFSDFGPHNFLNFLLFHYFKTVFILSLYEACKLFTLNKAINSAVLVSFLLLIPVSYSYTEFDSLSSFHKNESMGNIYPNEELNINVGDVYFIRGVKFKNNISAHHALFTDIQIRVNSESIKNMKDYRVFAASDGIYIHFFTQFHEVEIISMNDYIEPFSEKSSVIVYKADRVLW